MKTFRQLQEELLQERVLSIGLNPEHEKHREAYRLQIHDMLHKAYSDPRIGGYGGLSSGSKEESQSIHHDITHSIIKATKRGDKLTAVRLYKSQHGRKAIAMGTDGSMQGKKDALKTGLEDHTQKRSWGEVSGAPEHIMRKMGAPVVPSSHAEKLLGKKVTPIDHEYYERQLGNAPHRKVIMGHPKL